jgi:hypothetical protein
MALVPLCGLGLEPARAATGTSVCGTLPAGTTTWDAAGSPYHVCNSGVTVPEDAVLQVDASGGAVTIAGTRSGGIDVEGGVLRTRHTTVGRQAVFRAGSGFSSWAGIVSRGWHAGAVISLRHAQLVQPDGISPVVNLSEGTRLALDDVTSSAPVVGSATRAAVDHLHLTTAQCDQDSGPPAATVGLSLVAYSGSPPSRLSVTDTSISGPCTGLVIGDDQAQPSQQAVTVQRVAASTIDGPAIVVGGGSFTLGATGSIAGNTATGVGLPYVVLTGQAVGGFDWQPAPSSAATSPVGYLAQQLDVVGPGNVTIPPHTTAIVNRMGLLDARLDAAQGGVSIQPLNRPPYVYGDPIGAVGASYDDNATPADALDLRTAEVSDDIDVAAGVATDPESRLLLDHSDVTGSVAATNASVTIDKSTTGEITTTSHGAQESHIADNTTGAINIEMFDDDAAQATIQGNTVHVPQRSFSIPPAVPPGIRVDANASNADFVVRSNTVIGPGPAATDPPHSAVIVLGGDRPLDLSAGGPLSGNITANDAGDLALLGTLATDTTWRTPLPALTPHEMGFQILDLTVPRDVTLSVPAGGTIANQPDGVTSAHLLRIKGGQFVAHHGSTLRNLGINFSADHNHPARGYLLDTLVDDVSIDYRAPGYENGPYPGGAVSPLPFAPLRLHSVSGDEFHLREIGAPMDVEGLNVTNDVTFHNLASPRPLDNQLAPILEADVGPGSVIADSALAGDVQDGVDITESPTTIDGSRLLGAHGRALDEDRNDSASLACDDIEGNQHGGIHSQTSGLSITNSILTGNAHSADGPNFASYDFEGPGSATGDWWGQPGVVLPGQTDGQADISNPALLPPLCAGADPVPLPPAVYDATTSGADGLINLAWKAPTDPHLDHFDVRMKRGPVPPSSPTEGVAVYAGTATSASVAGLVGGGEYSFTVFTVDTGNPGYGEATVTTLAEPAPSTGTAH